MDTSSRFSTQVSRIQQAIRDQPGVDGWLFYDFRHLDPIAYRVLLLDPSIHVTRRWFYWVPAVGTPVKLQHRIEPHVLEGLPGEARLYVSWREQQAALRALLQSANRIAMQYTPMNAIPYLSRVDAGTLVLLRSLGLEVVTSADLVQQFVGMLARSNARRACPATSALSPDQSSARRGWREPMKLILRWVLNGVALMLIPEIITKVQVDSSAASLISAVLLGFVNAIIRPLLVLITLPITILTLDLFTLVINALMFWSVSGLVKGFVVPDFSTAFWGALAYSLLTWMVSLALADKD